MKVGVSASNPIAGWELPEDRALAGDDALVAMPVVALAEQRTECNCKRWLGMLGAFETAFTPPATRYALQIMRSQFASTGKEVLYDWSALIWAQIPEYKAVYVPRY